MSDLSKDDKANLLLVAKISEQALKLLEIGREQKGAEPNQAVFNTAHYRIEIDYEERTVEDGRIVALHVYRKVSGYLGGDRIKPGSTYLGGIRHLLDTKTVDWPIMYVPAEELGNILQGFISKEETVVKPARRIHEILSESKEENDHTIHFTDGDKARVMLIQTGPRISLHLLLKHDEDVIEADYTVVFYTDAPHLTVRNKGFTETKISEIMKTFLEIAEQRKFTVLHREKRYE